MVVRIHNVSKWAALQPGQMLELAGQQRRKIRVELNCPAPTRVDVVEGDKTAFICIVQGYEVVEFTAGQDAYLSCTSEDEVWYFTNDGDVLATSRPEAVSFTKIASRRTRNPELERMVFKMEQNALRREAALRAELDAIRAAQPAHDPETGEVIEDEREPAAADDPSATGEAGGAEPQPEASPAAKTAKGVKSNASA